MLRRLHVILLLSFCFAVIASPAHAGLKLPSLFSDHAVLQCDADVPVWGRAAPAEQVTVQLGDVTRTATADDHGKWQLKLPHLPASTRPTTLTITAGDETRVIHDILIGEVWLGSGQSNMTLKLSATDRADEFIAQADRPTIRLFQVGRTPTDAPADDVKGQWVVCSPQSAAPFSAVLYHFGRNLSDKLDRPVGLIHSSWGGTPIQSWMPAGAFPGGDAEIARHRARIAATYPSTTSPTAGRATTRSARHLQPTLLYNGMIAPLVPYAIRGVTWYQGENNVHEGDVSDYAEMMRSMVASWRGAWGEGEFPFLYVQLAPYGKYRSTPQALPAMWEQQTRALSMIPNSGMAAISDVGDANDIHPKDKHDVGERLARIALARVYQVPGVVGDAPMYHSHTIEGNAIRIRFTGVGRGLASRDGKPLDGFEIAGGDGKFVPADAKIDGDSVVVSSPQVREPKAGRFAWSPTATPNLMNHEGLPAVAFRTPPAQ